MATVFVLGTTGALVTATVDAGVTTITITQPSSTTGSQTTTPDGSTTTNTTVTETILALFNRTNTDDSATDPATGGNGCSDEAHERNDAVKDVNHASKTLRALVKDLGKDAPKTEESKQAFKDVDTAIKDIRQAVVKAIHSTFDCDKDDEDEDDASTTTTTGPSVAFGGDNPKALAELGIAAMEQQVTDLRAKLAAQTTTTNATNTANMNEKAKSASKSNKNDNKGKGNGKGRSGDDEDDD